MGIPYNAIGPGFRPSDVGAKTVPGHPADSSSTAAHAHQTASAS